MKNSLTTVVLIVCVLTSFLTAFMASALNLALPAIESEFHVPASLLTWVVTGFILSTAAFILPFGRLGDILGLKRIFLAGTLIYALASFLCALSNSFYLLLTWRVFQGLGGGMIFATNMAILTSAFPPGKRGTALGINTASVYLGLSLGPVLGGMLTQFGWRTIFYLVAIVGALSFLWEVIWLRKADWAGAGKEKYDSLGAILYSVSIALLIYGFSSTLNWGNLILAALGMALLIGFIFKESRSPFPLIEVRLFKRNVTFAFSNLAALINYTATNSTAVLVSLYLQVVRGFSPQLSGLILLAQPLIQALFSPISGKLSDRLEPRLIASAGMGASSLSLFVFAFLEKGSPLWLLILNLALLGFGFALFAAPNTNAVMGAVERNQYGIASSTLGTARLLGQSFSMAAVSFLFSIYLGTSQVSENPPAFMTSFKVAFVIFAILSLAGIFASLARGKVHSGSCPDS